jgi:hypothetical protein
VTAARRLFVLAALIVAVGAVSAPGASAGVTRCHSRVDFNVVVSSARNMACASARLDLRRYRGSIARRFHTPGGFACHRVSGSALGGQWRCFRGRKAYRFEFGD